jgi:hypothetical protein
MTPSVILARKPLKTNVFKGFLAKITEGAISEKFHLLSTQNHQ